jgi:hypothetical protein
MNNKKRGVEGLLPKLQVEAPLKQLSKKECYQAII